MLHSFTGGADGANPFYADVIFDSVGNLYGTAETGGANGYGVVFELSPVGAGWTETVLYSFAGGGDGGNPVHGLIMDPAGNLYGVTGVSSNTYPTVFELSPSAGGWTKQGIYTSETFSLSGLAMDAAGNIYGSTYSQFSDSTVFELSPDGSGGWNPTVIHTFKGTRAGKYFGALVLGQGNLGGSIIGTAAGGGANNCGTVYGLVPFFGAWELDYTYSFRCKPKDGDGPLAAVVYDGAGNIYGTTVAGGASGVGTVFELGCSGYCGESVLWSFNDKDGSQPFGSLILDSTGKLYGTAETGGSGGKRRCVRSQSVAYGDHDYTYVFAESVLLRTGSDLCRGGYQCRRAAGRRNRLVYEWQNGARNGIVERRGG